MSDNRFVAGGGRTAERGKPDWPDLLRLELPREEALRLVATIANQLAIDRGATTVAVEIFGQLTPTG